MDTQNKNHIDGENSDKNGFQLLDKSGNIYKQMFNLSLIPVIVHDMEMNIIEVNKSAVKQFGYPENEFLQKKVFDLHTPDEIDHSSEVLQKMEHEEAHHAETQFTRKDGSVFDAEVTPCKYILEGQPVIHVFINDITEKKNNERRIAQYNSALKKQVVEVEKNVKQLKRKNEELEQFAFVASHDLQEPLRTVTSYVQLLEKKYSNKLDDKGHKFIEFISKASKRMSSLIEGLLKYAQIGKNSVKEEVDCNELMELIVEDLKVLIKEKQIDIKWEMLPVVRGYKVELKSLFQNLIKNGIKYQQKDSTPRIKISAQEEKKAWIFKIKDNGIGIDKKHYNSIFTLYRRLHNQREFEGTGIGLAHCRKIVEIHDGDIWVESELNNGSTFHVSMPKFTL